MRLSTLLTIVVLHVQGYVKYQISNVYINAGRNISTLFPTTADPNTICVGGAELGFQFYPRVETSTLYIDQKPQQIPLPYANSNANYVNFSTTVSFSMAPANYYVLSGTVFFTCRGQQIFDYLVLRVEDQDTYNDTWPTSITGYTPVNSLTVTVSFDRSCDDPSMFGLRCNEAKRDTNNNDYCYLYNAGTRICCNNPWVNQITCAWNNQTCDYTSTDSPWCPDLPVDKGKENLYFWLMIGFVILSGILLILLLFLLLLMCMRKNNKQTVAPVYVQPVRAEVIQSRRPSERRHSERRERPRTRSREAPPYPGHRISPVRRPREDPRDSYQLEYDIDDDSLRNEWVEPMPRRVAKV